jgi:hypothetical protein
VLSVVTINRRRTVKINVFSLRLSDTIFVGCSNLHQWKAEIPCGTGKFPPSYYLLLAISKFLSKFYSEITIITTFVITAQTLKKYRTYLTDDNGKQVMVQLYLRNKDIREAQVEMMEDLEDTRTMNYPRYLTNSNLLQPYFRQ